MFIVNPTNKGNSVLPDAKMVITYGEVHFGCTKLLYPTFYLAAENKIDVVLKEADYLIELTTFCERNGLLYCVTEEAKLEKRRIEEEDSIRRMAKMLGDFTKDALSLYADMVHNSDRISIVDMPLSELSIRLRKNVDSLYTQSSNEYSLKKKLLISHLLSAALVTNSTL